jgi:hypothetical protein
MPKTFRLSKVISKGGLILNSPSTSCQSSVQLRWKPHTLRCVGTNVVRNDTRAKLLIALIGVKLNMSEACPVELSKDIA